MTKEEEYRQILGPYATPRYGNGVFGTSFLDAYRNANDRLGQWNDVVDGVNFSREEVEGIKDSLRAQKADALIGGGLAAVNGLTTIGAGAMQAAETADMTPYYGMLEDYSRTGKYNYNNYDELANDYAEMRMPNAPSYDTIRGMTKAQKWGNVGTSALAGFTAGNTIGGPIGGLIGAGVGAIASGIGIAAGNSSARLKQSMYNTQAALAQNAVQDNLAAAHERIGSNYHRQKVNNVVAKGGPISIKEYADRVLNGRTTRRERNTSNITRTQTEGGVKYRIRVK